MLIGLIRERKSQPDYRVAFTPAQCKEISEKHRDISFRVEPSPIRCFTDQEYEDAGIEVSEQMEECDILLGIKEVPEDFLIQGKPYFFFSHTKKKQPYNQGLMQAMIRKEIEMIDYECLTHKDEQRILGFGMYAGIVGAHNGILTYGKKHNLFELPEANKLKGLSELFSSYKVICFPNFKIAVTGSGKVATGIIEIMTQMDIEPVEPEDYLLHQFEYPVYTHLKGAHLYARKDNDSFYRDDFHANPQAYKCLFGKYVSQTDILMNGIYWDEDIARLFDAKDIGRNDWRISVISDITCDINGSVPINLGATHINAPVYGIDRKTGKQTLPYQPGKKAIDIMAVDNLPNELPRDASEYFGWHFEKFILPELFKQHSDILERATICKQGKLMPGYTYLEDYAFPS